MGKCARCGKDAFLFKNFKLKDAEICKKCFRALGFDKSYDLITEVYSYEEIKDGLEEYYRKKNEAKRPPSLADLSEEEKEVLVQELIKRQPLIEYGGKEKDLDCEPEEKEIFDILLSMYEDLGRNPEDITLTRYSDNYVTAKLGEWDLARIHWGPRAKWIVFPVLERQKDKHKITSPEDARAFADSIKYSVEHIEEYS